MFGSLVDAGVTLAALLNCIMILAASVSTLSEECLPIFQFPVFAARTCWTVLVVALLLVLRMVVRVGKMARKTEFSRFQPISASFLSELFVTRPRVPYIVEFYTI